MLMKPINYIYSRVNRHLFAKLDSIEKVSAETGRLLNEMTHRLDALEKYQSTEQDRRLTALSRKVDQNMNSLSIYNVVSRENGANHKKHILIAGFYGAMNLGDEIMLESLLDSLKQNEDFDITVMLADNYQPDLTRYGAYKFMVHPTNMLDINMMADYFDGIIVAGGALLDDTNYDISTDNLSLETSIIILSERLIQFKKYCVFYGLSTNQSITKPEYIKILDSIIQNSTYFSVRDTNSLHIIEKTGIKIIKVELVNDLIFTNHLLLDQRLERESETSITKNIGLIYIYTDNDYSDLLIFTQKLLKYSEPNVKYSLIPFYDFHNNDLSFAYKLINEIGSDRVSISTNIPKSYNNLITSISENDAIISMRYHGTLMSNLLGKKVLCINYDVHPHYSHKNAYIYDNYGFTKMMIDLSKLNNFSQKDYNNFEKLIVKRIDIKKMYSMAADELKNMISLLKLK